MANGLSGLAQALLGGVQAGAEATAQTGFREREMEAAEVQRQKGVESQRQLQKEKFAQQEALELSKIAAKGQVDKEIKQLDIAGRFNVADLKSQTDLKIANQRNLIEEKKTALQGETNETNRKRLEYDIDIGNRKLEQQINYQTRLNELGDLRIQISQEQNEIARDRLKTEYTFKQAQFQQDKKVDEKKIALDEKRFALEQAKSGPDRRRAIAAINQAENNLYQSELTEYRKYTEAKAGTQRTIDALDALIADPKGLKAAAGLQSNFITISGSKAADFEAALESLKGKIFSSEIQAMVGLGSLSDAEGKKIAAAAQALSVNMSDEALLAGLNELRTRMQETAARNENLRVEKPEKPVKLTYQKDDYKTPASEPKPEPAPKAASVILTHSKYGDITESDIQKTMEANNLSREQVLSQLEEQ